MRSSATKDFNLLNAENKIAINALEELTTNWLLRLKLNEFGSSPKDRYRYGIIIIIIVVLTFMIRR